MNKAPVTQGTRRSVGFFGRRKEQPGSLMPVAQPLTEAEAAAEIARAKDEQEAALRAREEKRLRKEAEKAARRAAKEARQAARLAAKSQAEAAGQTLQVTGGRFSFSLSTAACIGFAGLLCAAVLTAYVIGQRAGRDGGRLATVAAKTEALVEPGSPLLPNRGKVAPEDAERSTQPPVEAAVDNPDLAHLLQRPQVAAPAVNTNQPAKVETSARPGGPNPDNLNYLQIESFLVSRDRTSEQLGRDLAAVRQFLAERGVRTFARKRSNGYVLFAEEGFRPGKELKPDREAFIRKIERFGVEYRSLGGQYQFKGCFFVSYGATQAGEPVQ